MSSSEYTIYSVFLAFLPFGVLILLFCHWFVDKFGKQKKTDDKITKFLLYGLYISALCCSAMGYSIHLSKNIPLWCQLYGLASCIVVYASTKSFLLAFFLRRAMKSNIAAIKNKKWKKLFFERIAPLYVSLYFIGYATLASIWFRGTAGLSDNGIVQTYCLFDTWQWWFIGIANTVDFINCIIPLVLFVLPLIKSIKRLKSTDNVNKILLKKFVTAMKWNAVLSLSATITSSATLFLVPYAGAWMWMFCISDPFVNTLCAFLMIANNRKFAKHTLCKLCIYHKSDFDHGKEVMPPTNSSLATPKLIATVTTATNGAGSYNMKEIIATIKQEQQDTNTNELQLSRSKSLPIVTDGQFAGKHLQMQRKNSY